jgi:hypothetical protein
LSAQGVRIAEFSGTVVCRASAAARGIVLEGRTRSAPQEPLQLLIIAGDAPALPERLESACVDELPEGALRITAGGAEWLIRPHSWHLHEDITARMRAQLPPRRAAWSTRLMWRCLLGVLARPAGRRLAQRLLVPRNR